MKEGILNSRKEIARYDTAGSYTWTAPDYANGEPYSIGICIVGGGASGTAAACVSSGINTVIEGGASGFVENAIITVTPGAKYPIIVGSGGSPATISVTYANNETASPKPGGTSSFNGISAFGGDGGYRGDGAEPASKDKGLFGGHIINSLEGRITNSRGDPSRAINLFTNCRIVGRGSGVEDNAFSNSSSKEEKINPDVDPITKLGGGYSYAKSIKTSNNLTVNGGSATLNGCGGGAAVAAVWYDNQSLTAKAVSGAGGDGLVIIYLIGGSF